MDVSQQHAAHQPEPHNPGAEWGRDFAGLCVFRRHHSAGALCSAQVSGPHTAAAQALKPAGAWCVACTQSIPHACTFGVLVLFILCNQHTTTGLDAIASTRGNNVVGFENILLEPSCCLPPALWTDFMASLNVSASATVVVHTSLVCDRDGRCFNQTAGFNLMCVDIALPSEHYISYWNNVVQLCTKSTTQACIAQDGVNSCLQQCSASPPAPGSNPAPTIPDSPSGSGTSTKVIIWATVVPTGGTLGCQGQRPRAMVTLL